MECLERWSRGSSDLKELSKSDGLEYIHEHVEGLGLGFRVRVEGLGFTRCTPLTSHPAPLLLLRVRTLALAAGLIGIPRKHGSYSQPNSWLDDDIGSSQN